MKSYRPTKRRPFKPLKFLLLRNICPNDPNFSVDYIQNYSKTDFVIIHLIFTKLNKY